MRVVELFAALEAPVYLERCTLQDSKSIMKTRKAIRKALRIQVENKGFSLVEVLSPCPVGWKIDPIESRKWIVENMVSVFPLGVTRDRTDAPARPVEAIPQLSADEILSRIGIDTLEESQQKTIPKDFPRHELVLAGFGGQGILLLGQLLAKSSMREGKFVSWLPSYGPEMRGGTANCHVVVSPERIGSPWVGSPTVLVAMNQPSLEKFAASVRPGGYVVYDSSSVKTATIPSHVKSVPLPFSDIANKLGNAKVANMVAAGAIMELTGLTGADTFATLIHALPRKALVEINLKALKAGREAFLALGDDGDEGGAAAEPVEAPRESGTLFPINPRHR
jgi:2-oxoisovalerate ferredoxin oxidoreductase beta subunit